MKTYNVIMASWGGTERTILYNVPIEEATKFCEDHNWEWSNGGYIWELYIDDYEIEED